MTPKRRPGRPRLDPTGDPIKVSVSLTAKQYDATYALARANRTTVADTIRRALPQTNKNISK